MFRVRDLTRSYLADLAVRVNCGQRSPATLAWYRVQLAKLDKAAGDFPAADLRAHHLLSVEFTNHFVRCLKAVYRWATDEDQQLVPRDPFRKLTAPPCGERQRILTRAELVRLYRACSRPFRRFILIMARTVARPGEIRALLWGQVQWDRRIITWVKFKAKNRRRDGVKVRTIPLDRVAYRLLRNIYERRGRPGPDVPVWLDRGGKQLSPNGLRCRMRLARFKAGLHPDAAGEKIVCYTLRHTGATNACRKGIRGKLLSDLMGHARSSTTDRYQHLAGEDLVDAVDRIASRPQQTRPPAAG